MKRFIMAIMLCSIAFGVADGGSLRNEAGEHVILGVEDGTTDIKWIKLDASGYMITTVVPSIASAPNVEINNLTGGIAEASYTFGGNTALSFSVLNTTAAETLYVGLATGGPYITVFPHCSFSLPVCAEADLWYIATAALTTFDIVFTY